MKINGSTDSTSPLQGTGKSSAKSGTTQASSSGQSSSVSLSDLSAHLHSLESTSSTDGDFDSAKVENIKQAIRNGQFEVNSETVANKLISSAQELFGSKH